MEHITIPIPTGVDEVQKSELTQWLTAKVAEALPDRMPFEDEPEWQLETARRIQEGMADIRAGRYVDSAEARRRLDARLVEPTSGEDSSKGCTSE